MLLMLTSEALKISSYISLKKLYDMQVKFEQNCMVQTRQNFEVFDKKQNKTKTK